MADGRTRKRESGDGTDKFLLISLDDEKSKAVAEVLGSKTCKKIIDYLAEHSEASEKDLSDKLGIPLNTIEYNLKKLTHSRFVQKKNNFFWSKKGKKIAMYELSEKSIIISHKKSSHLDRFKSILPAAIVTAAGTVGVWAYDKISSAVSSPSREMVSKYVVAGSNAASGTASSATGIAPTVAQAASPVISTISSQPTWEWYFLGGMFAIFVFAILNWRKL